MRFGEHHYGVAWVGGKDVRSGPSSTRALLCGRVTSSVGASEWGWIQEAGGPFVDCLCGCVTFARGVSERDMLATFGMDPDSARMMTAEEVGLDPLLGRADAPPRVRVARVGEWAAGLECMQLKGDLEYAVERVSAGTEALCLSVTITTPGNFKYYVDGEWMTSFGIWEPYDSRAGADPNHLHGALAAAGLGGLDDGTLDDDRTVPQLIVALLGMSMNLFGIWLPRDVYEGSLPTASSGTEPYTFQVGRP